MNDSFYSFPPMKQVKHSLKVDQTYDYWVFFSNLKSANKNQGEAEHSGKSRYSVGIRISSATSPHVIPISLRGGGGGGYWDRC